MWFWEKIIVWIKKASSKEQLWSCFQRTSVESQLENVQIQQSLNVL